MNDNAIGTLAKLVKSAAGAVFAGMIVLSASSAQARPQNVTLVWNTVPKAAGYVVYTSDDGVNFSGPIDAGKTNTLSLTGLEPGATNYFYTAAYDTNHVQGAPSTVVSYIVPGAMVMNQKMIGHSPANIRFSVIPGRTYTVEASVDLINWVQVLQTSPLDNQWISYADPLGATLQKRFYRVLVQVNDDAPNSRNSRNTSATGTENPAATLQL